MGGLIAIFIIAWLILRSRRHNETGSLLATVGVVAFGWWLAKVVLGIVLGLIGFFLFYHLAVS
jgi:lipopolysaccharide export LptBFGC system permease protein LptF